MSTTLFCTAARAGANPEADRFRKLGRINVALSDAARNPQPPRTAIRIIRQCDFNLAMQQENIHADTAGCGNKTPITIQRSVPAGVAGK